ncbi:hypothetical protein Pan216_23550 [Planctomycetes bacterium Pan216]|uniref:Uncharacterized protein n=1 Tax=Kolteria novifilia TaxID=2527975 RepID=A0A518B3H5_9BACT|nr:hypothetical protein Pan216_23550 [Planctomycetes bacterium Pan216]
MLKLNVNVDTISGMGLASLNASSGVSSHPACFWATNTDQLSSSRVW